MALMVQTSDAGGTRDAEEVSKHIRDRPAVQLVGIRRPEHNLARSGRPEGSIETGQGSAAEAAPEETSKAGEEAGHATDEPGSPAAAKVGVSAICSVLNSLRLRR